MLASLCVKLFMLSLLVGAAALVLVVLLNRRLSRELELSYDEPFNSLKDFKGSAIRVVYAVCKTTADICRKTHERFDDIQERTVRLAKDVSDVFKSAHTDGRRPTM